VLSAHDVSDGGLAVALAECCFGSPGGGATVDLPALDPVASGPLVDALLFGESAPQVVVAAEPARVSDLVARAGALGLPARAIGTTGGDDLTVHVAGAECLRVPVAGLESIWQGALEAAMARR
jgi:phosphoribosylformylglycinamidine synthase